jgi:hypothetical protein
MKKTFPIIALIIIAAGIGAYFYYQDEATTKEPIAVETPDLAPPVELSETPEPRLLLETPTEPVELPQLESSDTFIANALDILVNNKDLMEIFINDQLINNIVVTIDNLPRKQVTMRLMPIKKAPGQFITEKVENETVISPQNDARYAKYVDFAEAVDPKKLVVLYVQLYPLFQKSYEALGYPDQYFNDRLMAALDDLLAAPVLEEPATLVQPKYFYLYADADLENRSIGQRILMRIGADNQKIVQYKLKSIQQELMLHMHEQKIDAVN